MIDEATMAPPAPLRRRLRAGVLVGENWLQFARFVVVGASGYVVNLVTFALCAHPGGLDYRVAAGVAFVVAVANNFVWNRRWTFGGAREGHAGFQALRFFSVSLGAFVVSFVVLQVLVEGLGVAKVLAQAIAIVVATPLNFVGNKLWSFGP